MLYRSATTNALYISDSVHVKSSPVGGNFTRIGIGNRVENGIAALSANAETYEIGELVATVSENGTLASNARLYLCVSNSTVSGSSSGFLDVGAPLGYSIGTNDNVSFTGQSVNAIRFLATSQIGIGTNSPSFLLDAVNTTNPTIRVRSTGTAATDDARIRVTVGGSTANSSIYLGDSVNPLVGGIVYSNSLDAMYFRAANSDRMTLNSTGLSTKGTITSSGSIEGTSLVASSTISAGGNISSSGTITATAGITTSTLSASSTITATGSITTSADFNTTSDIRVKKDITRIENALDKLEQLSGYTFTYKDTGKRSTGVIAQEVQTILPEAVSGDETLSVAYGNMVGLLIEAIKDLKVEVDAIKEKIN